jgi:hypothetical protein
MKIAGGVLLVIGVLALLLVGEHLLKVHRVYAENEIHEGSILSRIVIAEPEAVKAPPPEYLEYRRERRRVGLLWINWGIPTIGVLASVGGLALIVIGSIKRTLPRGEQ